MAATTESVSLDAIKRDISRLGIRTPSTLKPLISDTGQNLSWLIDLRAVFMNRAMLKRISDAFWERYEDRERFQLCGMEAAAIPLLTALLLDAPEKFGDINGFIIRKERKTTGLGNTIEGSVSDAPIVFVDDVINSGNSAEKARMVLASAGHRIEDMFAVIDYQSARGMAWRVSKNIKVTSLFTLSDFDKTLGRNPEPYVQTYRELWHTEVMGGYSFYIVPKSAPLLCGDHVYRGCDAGKMHAFDATNGSLIWEYVATGAAPSKGIWSTPAIHEGRIYFGAYNGCIYCLDARSGEEIWVQSYGEWVGASPLIVPKHGLVYFGIEYERPWAKGSIGAFDIRDGSKVWEVQVEAFQHGSPGYWKGGDLILWGTADHDMVALDAKTGEVRWEFKTRRSVKYAPAIDERRELVAFASFDKSIYLLDVRTGEKRGEWETGEICYTTPLFAGNKLFCGSGDRHLYVIDIDKLVVIKKLDLHARVYASPVLAGSSVIVSTAGGRVIELDVDTLEVIGQLQLPDAVTNAAAVSPDGSKIVISTYMNHLYAFERLDMFKANRDVAGEQSTKSLALTPLGMGSTEALPPFKNFRRLATKLDIAAIRQEMICQPEMWLANTNRQDTIAVQRNTESIFLRVARHEQHPPLPTENVHASQPSKYAHLYPVTMRWLEDIARELGKRPARALFAKLKPRAQVFLHVDGGDYYKRRDRYHLVITSSVGSAMHCGGEEALMLENELWWFDNKKPHEAFNHSSDDRYI